MTNQNSARPATKKDLPLKNGLTPLQVSKAREILAEVNVSQICLKEGVKLSTIHNVLRDQSPQVSELSKVLKAAKKQIKKKQRTLKALPL